MALRFSRGYLHVGRLFGAPARIHLATPVGLVVITGFSWSPAAWLGYFVLVIAHELGHALLVWRCGGRVLRLDVLPFGGECAYDNVISPIKHSLIAWGGVLAQGAIFGVVSLLSKLGAIPPHSSVRELCGVLLAGNFILIVFNLLPVAPLDGSRAWALFPHLIRRWRFRRPPRAR